MAYWFDFTGGVIAFRSSLNNLYLLFALLSKKNSFQIYLYSEHIWFCLKGGEGGLNSETTPWIVLYLA